ncbi:NnrS family protein [Ruegeria sp. WL0004]|uniref:NnrS family protein n=1 Tax=Ruegeria marisflavi TaxID=2984152 RepID=A0ABT2WQR3_9RHOB|nr:NnrS family protein [Ruegeria sp. WL0004]MCU9838250.1 NnrS family protein [Ruegeria sp. WL0004]
MPAFSRLFSEGFRVFFLAAGLYGLFTGLVWTFYIAGDDPGLGDAPSLWHAHEMIFGYATAAIGGFFLTAVPNWTGAPGARHGFIALAAGLWFLGRLAVWYAMALPPVLVAVVDLAFLPVLALKILSQLIKRPKPQNLMFLIFLGYLWSANLSVHLDWIGLEVGDASSGLRAGLITLCALIAVLGGRITPAFTRNAMKRAGEPEAKWPVSRSVLERAGLILAIVLPALVLSDLSQTGTSVVAIAFGVVLALRLAGWAGLWCLSQPILLSLHVALAMLALGMVAWGLSGFDLMPELVGVHLLGIGGVGGMTLAVMSRAALGHSGRPLMASRPMAWGYGLIAMAALMRWFGAGVAELYGPAMLATGVLWVAAFALYLTSVWPALTQPRVGRPG